MNELNRPSQHKDRTTMPYKTEGICTKQNKKTFYYSPAAAAANAAGLARIQINYVHYFWFFFFALCVIAVHIHWALIGILFGNRRRHRNSSLKDYMECIEAVRQRKAAQTMVMVTAIKKFELEYTNAMFASYTKNTVNYLTFRFVVDAACCALLIANHVIERKLYAFATPNGYLSVLVTLAF